MADIEISPLVETWRIANLKNYDIALVDVPGLHFFGVLKPLDANGNPQWIDALDHTTSDFLAASDTFRNALISSPPLVGTEGYKHTHEGLFDTVAAEVPMPDATTWHSHSGLSVLTAGVTSDADALHAHDSFSTTTEVNTLISTAIDGIDLSSYVVSSGSINQLADITSNGETIETVILLAHAQDHTLLEHLDDDPITMANVLKLFDGSNADCCHTHSNLGGGTFDGEHNDLDGLNEGDYLHLTALEYANLLSGGEHNDLAGLQGGAIGEYYHLTEDENNLVGRLGEDSSGLTFDGLPVDTGATSSYELPLGLACDGDWTDGLFPWNTATITSCAIDDINEVLGSLAPPPAPDLDDIDVDTGGVTGDLSFGASQGIGGYTNCSGIGALGSIDINASFANSGKRTGIIDDGVDVDGTLNEDVLVDSGSPNPSYPANAFGDANLGILILELNGVEQTAKNIDLTNASAQDTTIGDTSTGIDVIAATSVSFPGGDSFDQFKYRTGTYHVESGDMRSGWNYMRIIHRITSDTTTNYVDWVVDADNTATAFSSELLDTYNPSTSKHLSGVEYDTAATAQYDITISNAYRNTYIASNAVTFNETALNGVTNQSLAAINWGIGEDESKTHVITNLSVTVDTTNRRLINGTISLTTSVNRTVQTDSTSGGSPITGILFDNYNSSATETRVEDFIAETYRMRSNSDFTSTTFTSNWDETEFIYDAGNTGYLDGLQVTNDILDYPTLDYSSFAESPAGNPDYSGGTCSGARYYYRYFKDTSTSTANFTMNFNGSGTFVPEDEAVFSGNDIKVSIRLPGETNWMDCYYDFVTNQWGDGDGCRTTGNGNSGRDFNDWDLTVGTKNTANSGDGVYIRITVPNGWTGNISNLTFNFGFE